MGRPWWHWSTSTSTIGFKFLLLFLAASELLSAADEYSVKKRFGVEAQTTPPDDSGGGGGTWELLSANDGIPSMHTAIDHYGQAIFLDRTDAGPSEVNLTTGICTLSDCSAHSVLFLPNELTFRPLKLLTDPWCSSGQFAANGTLIQTGGQGNGSYKIRYFGPCPPGGICDWIEDATQSLQAPRWYASDQVLPDGRLIVMGGINQPSLEFVPNRGEGLVSFPFLATNMDAQGDNLYPYIHLLPDGNLWVFCNKASILYSYLTNTVLRSYPDIPGEPRSYPSAGSSVLLPLTWASGFATAEVVVCGGAQFGAYTNTSSMLPASNTCGRMRVTDTAPAWVMESMPLRRCMGDMLLLPTQNVLIINGAQAGAQGFDNAFYPALNPVLYQPDAAVGARFSVLIATAIPRMYHSTANLLPDGRILVAGSNPNNVYSYGQGNATSGVFPSELRVEAFSPPYLSPTLASLKPSFVTAPRALIYSQAFTVLISTQSSAAATPLASNIQLSLQSAPFATHSFSQGQRLLSLGTTTPIAIGQGQYQIASVAPANAILAPAGYYMLFAVNQGVPSVAAWVQISS